MQGRHDKNHEDDRQEHFGDRSRFCTVIWRRSGKWICTENSSFVFGWYLIVSVCRVYLLSVSVSLSVCFCACLPSCLSVVCLSPVSLFLSVSVSQSVSVFACLPSCPSVVCLSPVSLFLSVSVSLSVSVFAFLPSCLSLYTCQLSVFLSLVFFLNSPLLYVLTDLTYTARQHVLLSR